MSSPPSLTIQQTATLSGDRQTDTVLGTLPNLLRAIVTLGAAPQPGDTVTWAATGPGASVSPVKSVTDANGVATTTWTLGRVAGMQTATATLSGATGSPLTLTATATPGVATQMMQTSGSGQEWMLGTVLPQPLAVTVADRFGNGVPGLAIVWQVTSGSASVNPATATTDASGIAQTTVTLGGTPGAVTITASSASLAGSPQSFSATVQPIPTTVAARVGAGDMFTSNRNGTSNLAVDTVAAGGTVTWTWAAGSTQHSVQSTGMPMFGSSMIMSSGSFSNTFTAPGNYQYKCAVPLHVMTGTIVVR